jgi:hypothetical protein
MDVVTAFLNGKLTDSIYMMQPPGFEVPGQEHLVCLLLRSIYGLKQSPRTWYFEIHLFLTKTGWICSTADPNLYFVWRGSSVVILLIYVDDLLLTGNDSQLISQLKSQLMSQYKMKDLGPITRYLGVEFSCNSDSIAIHQSQYALKIRE